MTDIARYKSDDPTAVIQNWMRNRDVIEFLGLWERSHNPNFKPLEFEGFKKQAGANAFTMSPKKWIEATDAIGIVSKAGRYGVSASKLKFLSPAQIRRIIISTFKYYLRQSAAGSSTLSS